jgi:hypothetical protein
MDGIEDIGIGLVSQTKLANRDCISFASVFAGAIGNST